MSPIDRAEAWIVRLRDAAPSIEEARRVPQAISDELGADGFHRMLVPKSLGGLECHPRDFAEALFTLARGDAATGWIVMTSSTTGLVTAYLPETAAREILGDPADAALAGVFAPSGKATPVEGGYRLSGRWPFASGCENARWRLGGALVLEGEGPRMLATGAPEIRSCFFRADESQVIDTWRTAGLRGTGSHDMTVEDVFVPEHRTTCILADAPAHDGPLYRFPVFGLLATGISAVGLGIARAALDLGLEMARTKRSRGGQKTMGESELVQVDLATAEAELGASRAFLLTTLDETWEMASQGGALSDDQRARLRLAATHAAKSAAAVVDRVYHLCGGASIWDDNPLSRCFRDVHVMTQHVMVGTSTLKPVGRIALGLPTDTSMI